MKKLSLIFLISLLVAMSAYATTVTRSVSDASVETNDIITVTLTVDVTGSDTYYLIDEQFPSDITVTSATGDGDYTTTAGHIFWVILQGATDTTYTYTINSGNSDRSIQFTGTYGSESKDESNIAGDSIVSVGNGGPISSGSSGNSDIGIYLIIGAVIIGALFLYNKK